MDRARDRVCHFLCRSARRGRVVYSVGACARLCAVCDLSNRARDRSFRAPGPWSNLGDGPVETTDTILPDLQSCVLCEDVRCEFNGMQTLVGVLNVVAAPALPINYLRLCIWTRWCSGAGKFRQNSRIVVFEQQQGLAKAQREFGLNEMESPSNK